MHKTTQFSGTQISYYFLQMSLLWIPAWHHWGRNSLIEGDANKLGTRLEQRKWHSGISLPLTFIIVIASNIPMPGHGRKEGVGHSPLQNTRLDTGKAPAAAWRTPTRHLGFRQASALRACARATPRLRTARRQPLRANYLPRNACALVHMGCGCVFAWSHLHTGSLTGIPERWHSTAYYLLFWTKYYYERVSLTNTRVPDCFPNLVSDNLVKKLNKSQDLSSFEITKAYKKH